MILNGNMILSIFSFFVESGQKKILTVCFLLILQKINKTGIVNKISPKIQCIPEIHSETPTIDFLE